MTLLVGTPDIASTTQPPLSATLIYTHPYQRGDRLGMGSVALTYDWALGEWQRDGEAFDLVAARFGQSDPAPPEIRISFTIGAGQTARGTSLTLSPIENAAGILDITKPLHVAQWVTGAAYQSLQAQMQDSISSLNAFSAQGAAVAQSIADALPLLDQKLADLEQSAAVAAALANSQPYPNLAAFPDPATATKSAVALDTGAVYTAAGNSWGNPIGYVTTKQAADALAVRLSAVEAGQVGGLVGYTTRAALFADLTHPEGTLGRVTNDPTPANNGDYIKLGASGAGSWQAAERTDLTATITGSSDVNLMPDALNRVLAAQGAGVLTDSTRYYGGASLSLEPAPAPASPTGTPALRHKTAPVDNAGKVALLSAAGLAVGDTVTIGLTLYAETSCFVELSFRNGAAGVGAPVVSPATGSGTRTVYVTGTIPATCDRIAIRTRRPASDTGAILHYAAGLFRGSVARPITEDREAASAASNWRGGAQIVAQKLLEWAASEAYDVLTVTRNSNGTATAATVQWPDGSAGAMAFGNYNAPFLVFDSYQITHAASGKTVYQPVVTRNTAGAVTSKPALYVA